MRVDPSDAPTSTFFQPVIVHAILDAQDGRVLDAEVLQNSDRDLSRAAMDLVGSTSFSPFGISAGSIHQCAVSPARCGTGWAADIPLFRALGDLGTPAQSCAGESAIALQRIRTGLAWCSEPATLPEGCLRGAGLRLV
jgi:hypothetical protein